MKSRQAYSRPPESAFVALGYDTIFLVVDAAKRAGSSPPAAMRDALQQTRNLQGVTGLISYTDTIRIPVKGVTIVGVKDDELFVAGQILPPFVPDP